MATNLNDLVEGLTDEETQELLGVVLNNLSEADIVTLLDTHLSDQLKEELVAEWFEEDVPSHDNQARE